MRYTHPGGTPIRGYLNLMLHRFAFIMLSASIMLGSTASLAEPAKAAAPAAQATAPDNDYRLGPADKLHMIVFGETDLTGDYTISSSGKLALPLIGEVDALGLTLTELQAAIAAKYSQGYLNDPHVSLEVLTYRPFYILGEVNKPGEYPYTAGLTVMRAVATAAGYTYRANKHRVFIKHVSDAQEKPYSVDSATLVSPGDVIRVGERFF